MIRHLRFEMYARGTDLVESEVVEERTVEEKTEGKLGRWHSLRGGIHHEDRPRHLREWICRIDQGPD